MADLRTNLKVAATQAQLAPEQNEQVDSLIKILDTHKNLTNMPAPQAQQTYNKLPAGQKQSLNQMFGSNTPDTNKRGWLSNAWHYTGGAVFSGLNEISDFMTRLYRFSTLGNKLEDAEPGNQYKGIAGIKAAWAATGDNGEMAFDPNRINKARQKYGNLRTEIAIKVAAGQSLASIIANGTEEEKQFAAKINKNQDKLFQDTYDAVQASKYSPGRQIANTLLPESLEGTGPLYKGISGTFDAAYRVFADPTLLLGKAKKAYDAANYALFKIAGDASKVDSVFAKPQVVKFFDTYGAQLDKLSEARKNKDLKAAVEASTNLKRIAPEFGPAAVDEFIKAGVKDASTAKNYLANHVDVQKILMGQPARVTPLIPRMTPSRQARVAVYTTADKVFNIDKVGQKIVTALYGAAPQYEDIATGLTAQSEVIGALEKGVGKFKGPSGVIRFSINQIQGRLDRFARKFTTTPYFPEGYFDVNSFDASNKIYQIARLANSRYHAKIIQEAFTAGNEGQRKQIFTGLWNTVSEIRGVSKSAEGKTFMDEFSGRGLDKMYAPDIVRNGENIGNPANFDGQQMALFPYQLSSGIAVPSIQDLDRLSARSGLVNRILGLSHQRWADKLTSLWVIGTLAGPRFAVRNATEDLMLHLAIGDSPWGVAKGRMLSTRLRIGRGIGAEDTIKETAKKTAVLDVRAGELGVVNKFIRKEESARYAAKIDAAKTPEEVRQVLAEAVLENKLAYKLDPQGSEYLADIAKYGNLDDTLASVSEGGKNALRGGDRYLSVTEDVSRFGKMGELEINGVKYKQATGEKSYTQFNPVANQQSRISWLVQLGITTNDPLAAIAVRHLDNRDVAVAEMRKYLEQLSPKLRERFQLYSVGGNINVHAERAYEAVRNLFSKRNGNEINLDLLNKVRYVDDSGKLVVSSKSLTLDDLPNVGDAALVPEYISGPTLVPVADTGNFAASLADKTWDAMGEANARFSREPIVINEMIRLRKEMAESGFEKRFMEQFTKGLFGDELKAAELYAKKEIVTIAEQLAMNRVLAYVDNPAVRSQLAMTVRNFSRFYRATEDFYKRFARAIRYNPESLVRASLTYEGIAHSGFVQQDDNGDSYFFYPGLTPVYQTMQGIANGFDFPEAFKIPMPVEFGAKLNMLTPSLNPDSLFPTFAGPLAAVPMKFVFGLVPQLDSLESVFLGTYAQDQPMVNAIFPAHVTRLLAGFDRNERQSQYASAFRKAATYLEANGHGVKPRWDAETQQWIRPSESELQAYKNKISASTVTVLALRFMFGFFAPASPQVTLKSEMAKWVRDNGSVSYKQAFNELITKYNDLDKATNEWIRLFPEEMPYTVSESDDNVTSSIRAVDSTVQWISKNQDVLTKYPQGAPFLMPKVGDFNFDAYRLLFKSGIKYSKTIDTFLQDVSTARDKQFYYDQRDNYEAQLASTYDDFSKQRLKADWDAWSKQFKAVRPLLQRELSSGAETAIRRRNAYQDLQNMVNDPSVRKVAPATFDTLKKMSEIYDSYVYNSSIAVGNGASANAYKDMLKQNTKVALQQLAETDANAKDAYNTMFSGLLGD